MGGFDPYLIWLDIPTHERPVNFYRLLGLRPLESDPQTIAAAAERVIRHVSQFQQSPQAAACAQLLAELNAARACLLDPGRKQAYDRGIGMAVGGERAIASPGIPTQQVRSAPPAPVAGGYAPSAGSPAPQRQMPSPGGGLPRSGNIPASAAPQAQAYGSMPAVPFGNAPLGSSTTAHGGVAPIASRPAAPVQAAPTSTYGAGAPYPQQASPLAGNPYSAPAGMSPARSPMAERPLGYQPMAQTPAYAPAASLQAPAANPPPPMSSYLQAPAYPTQPPEWAASERTGQVTTVVAAPGATQEVSPERTQHRRVVRRQLHTSAAYMVVAFAIAMIVFFFGAVILLAIYFSNQ